MLDAKGGGGQGTNTFYKIGLANIQLINQAFFVWVLEEFRQHVVLQNFGNSSTLKLFLGEAFN